MTVVTRLLSLLLAALVLVLPTTASAQEQLGSVTITKLPTSLDTPGTSPVAFELSGGDLPAPIVKTSDTDTVRFSDLPPGTYHIRELPTRTGDVARATVAPMTVTIPQDGVYDIMLRPKVQPLMLTKSADVSAVAPGSRFTYILEGTVPLPDTNGQLHRYIFRDALPEGVTPTGDHAMQILVNNQTIALTEGEHYTFTVSDDRVVTATFTPTGLALLAEKRADNADLVVRFSFGVRVSTTVKPGTHLFNVAHLYPDGYPETGDDSVTSNEHTLPVIGSGGPFLPVIPGLPGTPGTPGTPGKPGTPGTTPVVTPGATPGSTPSTSSPSRPSRSGLASTGASVLGVVGLGAALTLVGITIMKRGRRD